MQAYHILPRSKNGAFTVLDLTNSVGTYHTLQSAKAAADALYEKTGDHYVVIAISIMWTTTMLEDALNEKVAL